MGGDPIPSDAESSPMLLHKVPADTLQRKEVEEVLQTLQQLGYQVLPKEGELPDKAKEGIPEVEHWCQMPLLLG